MGAVKEEPGEGTPVKTGAGGTPKKPAEGTPKAKASPTAKLKLKLSPKVLAKAKATAKAKGKAKEPEEGKVAIGKDVWKDVHNQLAKLSKSGKTHLSQSLKKATGHAAKRKWYYEQFLLDPDVSHKQVHKISLEKAKTTEKVQKGWVTKYTVGTLEGANPHAPNFEALCDAAVEHLPSMAHPNKKWADAGEKLYYYEHVAMQEEKRSNESQTAAKQKVDLDQENFEQVEAMLAFQPGDGKLMLGGKPSGGPSSGSGRPMTEEGKDKEEAVELSEEEVLAEAYKKCFSSLKKAINSLGTALDKGKVLKQTISSLPIAGESTVQGHIDALDKGLATFGAKKEKWLQTMGGFPVKYKPEEGKALAELEVHKEAAEADLKALNKQWAPLKLWARNEGHTV